MSRVGLELGRPSVLVLLWVLPHLAGCGCNNFSGVQVQGVVYHQGTPVPGMLLFFGTENSPHPVWGISAADGRFELQGERASTSIPRGNYTVWVAYDPTPTDPGAMIMAAEETQEPPWLKQVLAKYGRRETSPLKFEITKSVTDLRVDLD